MPRRSRDDDELTELVDRARSEDAANERSQRRWLRQQAESTATLAGVFLDALAAGTRLTIRTTSGGGYSGTVAAVGRDYVTVTADGTSFALRFSAVTAVLPDPVMRTVHAASDSTGSDELFSEMLSEAAAETPPVTLVAAGDPEPVTGTLRAVGADVVTVAAGARLLYVSLGAVSEVSFGSP